MPFIKSQSNTEMSLAESKVENAALEWFGEDCCVAPTLTSALFQWEVKSNEGGALKTRSRDTPQPASSLQIPSTHICLWRKASRLRFRSLFRPVSPASSAPPRDSIPTRPGAVVRDNTAQPRCSASSGRDWMYGRFPGLRPGLSLFAPLGQAAWPAVGDGTRYAEGRLSPAIPGPIHPSGLVGLRTTERRLDPWAR